MCMLQNFVQTAVKNGDTLDRISLADTKRKIQFMSER